MASSRPEALEGWIKAYCTGFHRPGPQRQEPVVTLSSEATLVQSFSVIEELVVLIQTLLVDVLDNVLGLERGA